MLAPTSSRGLRAAALGGLVAALLALAPAAQAKGGEPEDDHAGGGASAAGDFAVTVNGVSYNPAAGKDVKLRDVTVRDRVAVKGVHVGFLIDPSTLGVYDYSLTGAQAPDRMVTRPTVIFASKVPSLTASQRSGARLSQLEVRDDTLTAIFTTSAGKLKVQAKDAPQGGIFQMEPEFGTSNVVIEHKLGPTLFYFVNSYTGKINFADGQDAVSSGPGAHQMLLGKDSPQVATKTFQDGTTTRWSVASGGRMGGVLGEDAIELSQGATSCTQACQAQNRIRGSLPVPPTRRTPPRSAADPPSRRSVEGRPPRAGDPRPQLTRPVRRTGSPMTVHPDTPSSSGTSARPSATALRLLQLFAVLSVVNVAWQFVTAGELFPGPDDLHAAGAITLHVTSGLVAIAACVHWYRARTSPAVAILAVVVFVLSFVQAATGGRDTLAVHIPGAMVLVAGSVWVLVWSLGRAPRL
ncbi:hypothetical protein [Marmoricola endophyticus]|nr:hypothetical protein [Marmoricola endophyticus]